MALKGIFIDANLLVLLVVGATDQALIAKHRRLRRFVVEDYGRLLELIGRAGQVFLTPNTLTYSLNIRTQTVPDFSQYSAASLEKTRRSSLQVRLPPATAHSCDLD